jgi:citronellol/citronellal dehydrogenase
MRLENRVAIVTGASRGLGRAIALGLAGEGAAIIVAARTDTENPQFPGTIQKTADDIKASGHDAIAVKCDVTDEESVQEMVRKALDAYGHIDILVNNAGIAFYYPVVETPLKRWNLVLGVNLTGAFICSKIVLPGMIARKSGSIINISSLAANERDKGFVPTGVAYGVAKAGLERFTWGMAAELGEYNIAVNAIKPVKVVDTEGMRFWQKNADKSQWQTPEKMVKCAIFLAAQDTHRVTGTVATDEELCAWYGL